MPAVVAHRGLHQRQRENTLEAFRAAVSLGVDGVELDVRRTLDGEFVVHHDAVVNELVIAQTNASQLPSYVPTLDQSLEVLAGLNVNVEIKNIRHANEPTYDDTGDFARDVVRRLRTGGWAESVIISCFDLATCAVVRSFDQDVKVGWLLWADDVSEAMLKAHVLGLSAVHPPFTRLDDEGMMRAAQYGLDVNVWTVNAASDIAAMDRLGVAGIITDDPALAMSIVGRPI
ncbi:MAG: glycerophosphodiester phosphodiesterase [Acidimicrobiales bacterium]